MQMKLRDILRKYNIQHKVIADALGMNRINIDRYDNLYERTVNEVMLISKATGISISELLDLDDQEMKRIDKLKFPDSPREKENKLVASLQNTIEAQEETIKAKNELIEMLKNKG